MKLQTQYIDGKGYVAVSDERIENNNPFIADYTRIGGEVYLEESFTITEDACTEQHPEGGVRGFSTGKLFHEEYFCKKIIATDTSVKLEGIPQFQIKSVFEEALDKIKVTFNLKDGEDSEKISNYYTAWYDGYSIAAQEKGCYSEEDLQKYADWLVENGIYRYKHDKNWTAKSFSKYYNEEEYGAYLTSEFIRNEFIQFLKQPKKLIGIEVETICAYGDDCPSMGAYDKQHLCKIEPKVTNGLLTVTKYIYE